MKGRSRGREGRTHLMSPAMAAAAAVTGTWTDVREMMLIWQRSLCPWRAVPSRGRPKVATSGPVRTDNDDDQNLINSAGHCAPLPQITCRYRMIIPNSPQDDQRVGLGAEPGLTEMPAMMTIVTRSQVFAEQAAVIAMRILVAGDNFAAVVRANMAPWGPFWTRHPLR